MEKKNFLYFMLMMIMGVGLFASCSKDNDPDSLEISKSSFSDVDASGITESFSITSNVNWTISGIPNWVTVSPTQGKGNSGVSVTITENATAQPRNCTLNVSSIKGDLNRSIQISQNGANVLLKTDKTTMQLEKSAGSSDDLTITTNMDWTLSGLPEWLNATAVSGNGTTKITLRTLTDNENDEEREATLTITAEGQSVNVVVKQKPLYSRVRAIPSNLTALYNQIAFEIQSEGNVYKFYYAVLSESYINRYSDKDIVAELLSTEAKIYNDDYMMFPGGFTSNTTYYVCTIAFDYNNNRGKLIKTPIKTLKFLNEDDDAYCTVDFVWGDSEYNSIGFQFKKQGYCNKYHAIYGVNLPAEYAGYRQVIYAFEINYYLKYGKKHWFAENWNLNIQTNYPNDHTFIVPFNWSSYYGGIVGYAWGIFQNGDMSSDMLGGWADLFETETEESPKQFKTPKKSGIRKSTVDYTTRGKEMKLKAQAQQKRK